MLGQVGLELEVGAELAGAELTLVGAVYDHDLFGLCLALLLLAGLDLGLVVSVLHVFPLAALRIAPAFSGPLLRLPWSFCSQAM